MQKRKTPTLASPFTFIALFISAKSHFDSCLLSLPPRATLLCHLSALHAFAFLRHLPSLPSPTTPLLHPYRIFFFKVRGNSLHLKISTSLCACGVTSPKAAPRYGWVLSHRLVRGPQTHTHTAENAHTVTKDTHKQLSVRFASFVIAALEPIWPQSFPVGSKP